MPARKPNHTPPRINPKFYVTLKKEHFCDRCPKRMDSGTRAVMVRKKIRDHSQSDREGENYRIIQVFCCQDCAKRLAS